MEEALLTILKGVDWAEGIQILFLIFIAWVARKARISNGQLEERLRYYIEDSITRQDERIQKRIQRQPPTPGGQLEGFQSGQTMPGYPPGLEDLRNA